jgi:hypothetical protein
VSLNPGENIVQSNSGTATGQASFTVTLPAGVRTDATVLIGIQHRASAAFDLQADSERTRDATAGTAQTNVSLYRVEFPAAGTNSWLFTIGSGTTTAAWWVVELAGVDLEAPVDVIASSTADTDPQPTGTTAANSADDVIAIAVFGAFSGTEVAASWSGYTNSFTELADVGTPGAAGTTNVSVAGAYLIPSAIGPYSSTATQSGSAQATLGLIVVYRANIAKSYFPIVMANGFGYGTAAGHTAGTLGLRPADVSSNAAITSAAAHTGPYGLRLTAAASIATYGWTSPGAIPNGSTRGTCILAFRMRINSVTGTVIVAGSWRTTPVTRSTSCTTRRPPSWVSGSAPPAPSPTRTARWPSPTGWPSSCGCVACCTRSPGGVSG